MSKYMKFCDIDSLSEKGCLSATFLKFIALLCMTVDHLGAYSFEIPIIGKYAGTLRSIGRIAAPLFLYFVVESYKKTGDKKRLFTRLYVAAAIVGICNYLMSSIIVNVDFGNILHTFTWTVGILYLFDKSKEAYTAKNYKMLALGLSFAAAIIIILCSIDLFLTRLESAGIMGVSNDAVRRTHDIFLAVLRTPRLLEYSFGFVFLGIVWYFQKSRLAQCISFVVLCIVSRLLPFGYHSKLLDLSNLRAISLPMMVMFVVLIALYNGKRGRGMKYFFYIYYPVHCYIIVIATKLMGYI